MRNGSDTNVTTGSISTEFEDEVINGLKSSPKTLPSKYFYDSKGDELFQQIMGLPEYYLTRCEFEIFESQKEQILKTMLARKQPFQIIELGAGDGLKTKILLRYLDQLGADVTYIPIDISSHVLQELEESLKVELPNLKVKTIAATYHQAMKEKLWDESMPILMLFVGSSLGNYNLKDGYEMITLFTSILKSQDQFLIGLDLQKDPSVILAAYNDQKKITEEFNLNLLDRINRELDADFKRENFKHFPIYDPIEGAAKSYIISKEDQIVHINEEPISFYKGEPIYTEISQKYKLKDIETMAHQNKLKVAHHFTDSMEYFVNSLWIKE